MTSSSRAVNPGASARESVEAPGVLAGDLRAHALGDVAPLAQRPRALRPAAIPVRIVARVHDEVRAEDLRDGGQDRLLRLAADPDVPCLDVRARVTPPPVRDPVAALLPVLVHAVDEVRHPADARLQERDAQL